VRTDMSPEDREESLAYLNALWLSYRTSVAEARGLTATDISDYVSNLVPAMLAAKGNAAKVALDAKLVTGLKSSLDVDRRMVQLVGSDTPEESEKKVEADESDAGESYNSTSLEDYLRIVHAEKQARGAGKDKIGVIIASGEILDGSQAPGTVGGETAAQLIRSAREDDDIKAIVLRVDSPGGSAYGSELIRRELELARAAGKPVVISMGNVAASGGYWISMASDEIIADRSTITGSIGVYSLIPTVEKVADKLGIHTAGHTTTWLAGATNLLRPLDPRFGQLVQSSVSRIYTDFTTKAAVARKTTPAKIDEVAQGRVWTGLQAQERGLVDTIGSYGDALRSAAKRAKLGDDYRVAYIERDESAFERALLMFGASASQSINIQVKLGLMDLALPQGAIAEASKELAWLADLSSGRKPFQAITHCMCGTP